MSAVGGSFSCKFGLGDRVNIDKDAVTCAVITGISITPACVRYACSWVYNGDLKEFWVDEWRVSKAGRTSEYG